MDAVADPFVEDRFVEVAPDVLLWSQWLDGPADADPVLLVMGANASGIVWPEELLARLTTRHPVIRYDHRDTGRSTWAFDDAPYAVTDLAADAVAVLDAWGVERAHVVGMSLGGTLVQLLLLDHPDRLLSATVFCTAALSAWEVPDMPGPGTALLRMWQEFDDPRDDVSELAWRVEHWRLLNGAGIPFDADEFRELESRVISHTGRPDSPSAHARADQDGLDRGAELARVTVPVLVVEAPEDPVNPPPHGEHLAAAIGGATLVTVPGLGHALPVAVVPELAEVLLVHTGAVGR
ncbi:alpha/beta fold hydrolase [Pseudonocardia sp. N23]|uniref:alpha/beta fold hydrolase n=1 Tax=Pseudonocardia sp. N23 TaxID=1987376 RepID=UPI000C02848D|nr:alpha/beta hydrolase [Pseudonocardia sp. N23]GAY08180.1 putative hydrolase [Pseudonocardia sp. N23]